VKIFISFDMEGVAGIVDWSQCRAPGQPYEEGRKLLLGEVNAAIDGALLGGATEVVCNDSHGAMNNLDPAELHGRAVYIAGRHKPLYMMEGMDESVDAVFFVGYHGSISGESSVLSHTYNPSVMSKVTLNGKECGESGINALVARAYDAPVALITGDQQTITEGNSFFKEAEGVVVKESISRFAATQIHPLDAREKITGAATRAVQRLSSIPAPDITLPARLDVDMQTADMAGVASWVKGVERTGTRSVCIEGDDPLAVFRSFVGITYITRVAEGRLRFPRTRGRSLPAELPTAPDLAGTTTLRRVEHQVGAGRDREREHDDRERRPSVHAEQDQANNDPDPRVEPLLVCCHDDSIRTGCIPATFSLSPWRNAVPISMPVNAEANELLTRNPLALLIAMLLDQQVPLERAFSSPRDLWQRLDHEPTAEELASFDPERLAAIFSERPALHRFPKAMAARTQDLARLIVDEYDGDPAAVWTTAPSGAELLRRVAALPGFGEQKARIFVALLGKQLGVRPEGWREVAGKFGEEGSYLSVADISDDDSLARVRSYKQALKAAAKAKAAK
jgi:D-amino peptidase